jgi:acyl-CoA hydrolase
MEPELTSKPVCESCAILAHWMGVTDANSAGNIHGGTIMKLADEAAGLAAIKYARQRVVTVGMDRMDFLVPVYVGELVTFRATVNAAWRTSMEVGVRVEAENPVEGIVRHTNTAYLTMVALDADGRPSPVPPPLVESVDERRRQREAELRRSNRLAEREQMLEHRRTSGPPGAVTPTTP